MVGSDEMSFLLGRFGLIFCVQIHCLVSGRYYQLGTGPKNGVWTIHDFGNLHFLGIQEFWGPFEVEFGQKKSPFSTNEECFFWDLSQNKSWSAKKENIILQTLGGWIFIKNLPPVFTRL